MSNVYFIKEDFFDLVNDPYLKQNKGSDHLRPHFLAVQDSDNKELFWVVPLSTKVEKFDRIVRSKKDRGRPCDGLFKTKVNGKDNYLLMQDMFPVSKDFIEPYIKFGVHTRIRDSDVPKAIRQSRKVIMLLKKGVQFTPSAPNINKIQETMENYIAEKTKEQDREPARFSMAKIKQYDKEQKEKEKQQPQKEKHTKIDDRQR